MAQESKLQGKIIGYLEFRGWIAHKIISSSKPGWPDIEAFKHGERPMSCLRVLFIEVKSIGKKADPLQIYRHDLLRQQGFDVHVVDSWEEFTKLNIQ